METNPAVSRPAVGVVVPAYNAARYIRQTLASVLDQTWTSLEVIVVDDGSTDGTAAIASSTGDRRVRVVTRENGGPSAARNDGWRSSAATRYIAFLDADDQWDRAKLARQVSFLDDRPDCVVAGCLMRYISSTGGVLGRTGQVLDAADQPLVASGELFPFPLSAFLVRREVLERIGGFEEALGRPSGGAEDIDLLARLAEAGTVGCVPAVLGSYRIHPSSAMARDRLRINREARFIRQRLRARRHGTDLTWDAFVAADRADWRVRRQDVLELCYRSAALWYGEGRLVRAIAYGLLAAIISPRYTVRRLYRQRLSRTGLAADRGATA
jgi:glycosyltransferase involved in cell wall biosynthesis